MLSKELEILKHISELYKADVSDEDFVLEMQGKETLVNAWREAFEGYFLQDVINVIDEYFVKKNNRTPPRIPQILAMLNANKVEKSEETPEIEAYHCDLDVRYMHEDVKSGDCHHNIYYYTAALRKIRNGDVPWLRDEMMPSKADLTEVMERICEDRTGQKWEFLSRNDFISQGYDINKRYNIDLSEMFKKIN